MYAWTSCLKVIWNGHLSTLVDGRRACGIEASPIRSTYSDEAALFRGKGHSDLQGSVWRLRGRSCRSSTRGLRPRLLRKRSPSRVALQNCGVLSVIAWRLGRAGYGCGTLGLRNSRSIRLLRRHCFSTKTEIERKRWNQFTTGIDGLLDGCVAAICIIGTGGMPASLMAETCTGIEANNSEYLSEAFFETIAEEPWPS